MSADNVEVIDTEVVEAPEPPPVELHPEVVTPAHHPARMVEREHLDLLRTTLNPDLNEAELALFAQVANRVGLDPFARQIYAVKRKSRGNPDRVTFQTGIDGYRLIARRTGQMAGRLGPYFADSTGRWRMMPDGKPLPWLETVPPAAAMVGVVRHGDLEPTWGLATWAEYAIPDGNLWKKMPSTMLAKCAEAQAIRACFPAETSGIYTEEEMDQADRPAPSAQQGQRPTSSTPPAGGALDPWTASPRDVVAELRRRNLDPAGTVPDLRQRLAQAMLGDPPPPIDTEVVRDGRQEPQGGPEGEEPTLDPEPAPEAQEEPAPADVPRCSKCSADLGEVGGRVDAEGVGWCPQHEPF